MLKKYDVYYTVLVGSGDTHRHKTIEISIKANNAKEALELAKSVFSIEVQSHNKGTIQPDCEYEAFKPNFRTESLFGKKMFDKSDLLA